MQTSVDDKDGEGDLELPRRRRVLLIPFHFPPIQGSTGASRLFEFARWLPEHGWNVTVLSVTPRAYPKTSEDIDHLLPPETRVVRAFALDAKRHLSLGGRYLRWSALPDRWSSWMISGVARGIIQIRKNRPDIIYTTYPTPTSHLIGLTLHKLTGIPWIAEFRDPMVEEGYPEKGAERSIRVRLERAIFRAARRVVAVTPSAKSFYEERAGRGKEFVVEIPNGYSGLAAETNTVAQPVKTKQLSPRITIIHSGFLYEDVRNPRMLLSAIRDLARDGLIDSRVIRFVFRGSGNEADYTKDAASLGINELVEFRESVTYTQAHQELQQSDALLLMQGRQCNRQIPAKLYEYCVLQKPILCLADPEGDTGHLFESLGLGESAALEDSESIKLRIISFLDDLQNARGKVLDPVVIEKMSRRARTEELTAVLNEVYDEDHVT